MIEVTILNQPNEIYHNLTDNFLMDNKNDI